MTAASSIYPPDRVSLREVGLRDGLQLVKTFPSTTAKIHWIEREFAAGVRHFEVGSFLPASHMPQFADVRDLIACVAGQEGATSAALTMNERGIDDAMQTDVDELVCVVSATEAHSQANMRRSRAAAVDLVRLAAERTRGTGKIVDAAISMAFGCSIAGEVDGQEVLRLVESCIEAGADMVGIADTVGFAGPSQMSSMCASVAKLCGDIPVLVHLHDTRGMGIANASAALDAGVRILDGSLGGLGGCPFAPGATGNVVFEDLVFLCETKGFRTGIDLDALVAVRSIPETEMPDEPLHGHLAQAGVPVDIHWQQ